MNDYISREAAVETLHYNSDESCASVVSDFEAIPAADVEPVRHGRWVPSKFRNEIERCSKCKKVFRHPSFYGYKFCPNCGAKMDLEDKK